MEQQIIFAACYLDHNKIRLDEYLSNCLRITRSFALNLIKNQLVFVNDQAITKQGTKLSFKDVITVYQQTKQVETKTIPIQFQVIYEDKDLMVINKPRGLLCHPTSFNETNTLVAQLGQYYLKQDYHLDNLKDLRNGLVHRLDKDTSGLLLVAKNIDVFNLLKQGIETKAIKRYYYALVCHPFANNVKEFSIDLPLDHLPNSTKVGISYSGKQAVTKVKVLHNYQGYSLVECELLTGRTHQIRVHLSAINHPLYNDPLYGTKIDDNGQYLSAYKLTFIHPITNQELCFTIPFDSIIENKITELNDHD
ncbi:RluA family pseudouridine synthase [bacterium]|nr:RluA family pseudouridine synthase [bacterium]